MKKQTLNIFKMNPIQTLESIGLVTEFLFDDGEYLTYQPLQRNQSIKISPLTGDWYHYDGLRGGDLFDLFARVHDLPKDLARHQLVNEVARALGVEDNIYG